MENVLSRKLKPEETIDCTSMVYRLLSTTGSCLLKFGRITPKLNLGFPFLQQVMEGKNNNHATISARFGSNSPRSFNSKAVLNIFYQNVGGIKTKLHTWKTNLLILEYTIVAATETFLDSSVEDAEVVCGGWSLIRRDRRTYGGGVLLSTKPSITPVRQHNLETLNGEDVWIKFNFHGINVNVCVVYIPPSATDAVYFDWLKAL
ncbi:unnamed protein product [Parnassius mnemosyne]|uniref:Uncharacterized protein n=1 Tax=Parnassius mnemosyne TaxID=213953 RepID=A0AAV1KBB4_9NEOP